jgi:hypothetical protein
MDASERALRAGHDLLVELAGRLPDELLWRLRDWLAAPSGADIVGVLLPRELMRAGVGVTDRERDLLGELAGSWGPARWLLDAVLPAHEATGSAPAFAADDAPADAALLTVLAVVRAHPGCTELSVVRREGRRVVLVRGGERAWALAATLQRLLRAHGDRTPCVEVLADGAGTDYHRAATAVAPPLWSAAALAVAS